MHSVLGKENATCREMQKTRNIKPNPETNIRFEVYYHANAFKHPTEHKVKQAKQQCKSKRYQD